MVAKSSPQSSLLSSVKWHPCIGIVVVPYMLFREEECTLLIEYVSSASVLGD
ncbi:hypothetical protein ANAPRD1_00528 [Anaplasma phagocytophilum]|nr:hypothetical protein ANAPRD1_00528 [Anaplasma phagocytophilum]SCV64433.1 hypothetical protein ANAPH1_00597 [Anaplasma phagocytophilum]